MLKGKKKNKKAKKTTSRTKQQTNYQTKPKKYRKVRAKSYMYLGQ